MSSRNARLCCEIAADMALQLMRGPKTISVLAKAMQVAQTKSGVLHKYLTAFMDKGLVFISHWHTPRSPVYAWNPSPGLFRNAEQPTSKRARSPQQQAKAPA